MCSTRRSGCLIKKGTSNIDCSKAELATLLRSRPRDRDHKQGRPVTPESEAGELVREFQRLRVRLDTSTSTTTTGFSSSISSKK